MAIDIIEQESGEFLVARGIVLNSELKVIKKKQGGLIRPVFEAFSNAWESLIERFTSASLDKGKIEIAFYVKSKLLSEEEVGCDYEKIVIRDNGTGITNKGFERIMQLRDSSKSASNKGTGRVQYVHSFQMTEILSVYRENGETKKRRIKLSKADDFISKNAIMWFSKPHSCEGEDTGCVVEFQSPWIEEEADVFSEMRPAQMKVELLQHYICRFAHHREAMPKIILSRYLDGALVEEQEITKSDIMTPHKEEDIEIAYSTINDLGKVVTSNRKEKFTLISFVEDESIIPANAIYLLGKEELANKIPFYDLKPSECIEGKRYLFFLSGKYLDERDDDARGDILLERKKDFRAKAGELPLDDIDSQQILREDIEEKVNENIARMYTCIAEKKEEQYGVIDELKNMFILDDEDVRKIRNKIKTSDSPSEILEKVYDIEAKRNAKEDAGIRTAIKELSSLNPKDKDYKERLQEKAKELSDLLPARNKILLSRYVCRRKIVLDLLDELLQKSQSEKSPVDESTLHNLFIARNSTDVSNSDMWIMNEEYLYFRGVSDKPLDLATLDGRKILKERLTEEEEKYKCRVFQEIEQDQGLRRPDVLLFPEENKCIIIEFKAPKVDVSKHLDQISRYATLIRNLAKDEFLCDKFYGYLIGENINYDSVTDAQAEFEEAPSKDCLYRTNAKINGKFGRSKGYLYTEIIKYSDLLKRARRRNQVFNDILFNKVSTEG